MVDIPGNATTTTNVTVGSTTTNALETVGDHDWFRINLAAGQAITVTLNGVTLQDPYLRIIDRNGVELYFNDDIHGGVDLDSLISFAANYTGIFYIDVGSYNDEGAGTYQLNVTAFQTPPVFTNDQIAQQLVSGYWGDGPHPLTLGSGRSLTVNISALNTAGQILANQALQTWSEITGITFVTTFSSTPDIRFTDNDPDGGAFTEIITVNGTDVVLVNVDAGWLSPPPTGYGPNVGDYSYQAYLHEIGHALGLGHAGNYNEVATYPYDALYLNDSYATSVMSYFNQTESEYFSSRGFSHSYVITPMVADILAVQQLYGLSATTRSGNTTYGFNSNAGPIYNANTYSLANVAYTIFDAGGTDTLDYSQYNVAQRIDLNPEQFSNIGGQNGNVTIARGTIIENAIGGFAADVVIGNSAANVLSGRSGVDTLTGGLGADTFQDTTVRLSGDTITDFSVGDKIVFTDATLATFTFNLTGNTLNYSGGSLILSAPINGTITASAAASGGVQLSIMVANDVRNDFNGDGRSDVLWRHDNGQLSNWLGQANGGFVGNDGNAFATVSTSWQVAGTGDFNGDGRDDILWRSTGGQLSDWLGTPSGGWQNNDANAFTSAPTNWKVAGVGDFNGDGRDDILWRSDAGQVSNWLGTDTGGWQNNDANAFRSAPTSWKVAGVGDFNGDGRDDILWRNDNGQLSDWLGQANGGFVGNDGNALVSVSTSWKVIGVGDFNGDNRDDILWRNDNGQLSNWLGQANGGFAGNDVNALTSVPLSWHIAQIGDFNGDGRDDILWRSDTGGFSNWLGQANGGFAGNDANAFNTVPTAWHVQDPDIFWL